MRILKLLNKKFFLVIVIFFSWNCYAEEKPVDIWNIDKETVEKNSLKEKPDSKNNTKIINTDKTSVYDMQSKKKI